MKSERAAMPEATRAWMIDTLLGLLQTPSPSGRTDAVMQLIGDVLDDLGVPFTLTRRGALTAELPGESKTIDRAVVVHADTIGCMVRDLKDNGRLELIPVGTFSARFATGARVRIFTDDPEEFFTGTVMPLKAPGTRSATRSTPSSRTGRTSRSASIARSPPARTWSGWASTSVTSSH